LSSLQSLELSDYTFGRDKNKRGTVDEPRFSSKLREIGIEEKYIKETNDSSRESDQNFQDFELSNCENNEEEDLNQSDLFPITSDVPDLEDPTKTEEIVEYLNVELYE